MASAGHGSLPLPSYICLLWQIFSSISGEYCRISLPCCLDLIFIPSTARFAGNGSKSLPEDAIFDGGGGDPHHRRQHASKAKEVCIRLSKKCRQGGRN